MLSPTHFAELKKTIGPNPFGVPSVRGQHDQLIERSVHWLGIEPGKKILALCSDAVLNPNGWDFAFAAFSAEAFRSKNGKLTASPATRVRAVSAALALPRMLPSPVAFIPAAGHMIILPHTSSALAFPLTVLADSMVTGVQHRRYIDLRSPEAQKDFLDVSRYSYRFDHQGEIVRTDIPKGGVKRATYPYRPPTMESFGLAQREATILSFKPPAAEIAQEPAKDGLPIRANDTEKQAGSSATRPVNSQHVVGLASARKAAAA